MQVFMSSEERPLLQPMGNGNERFQQLEGPNKQNMGIVPPIPFASFCFASETSGVPNNQVFENQPPELSIMIPPNPLTSNRPFECTNPMADLASLGNINNLPASFYRTMVETVNKKLRDLYDEGIRLRNIGDYEGSVSQFEQIIFISPDNITGYNSRGFTRLQQGEMDLALKDFMKCARLDSTNITVLLNIGKCFIQMDRVKRACGIYGRIIKLQPKNAKGYNGRGVCLKKLGYPEAATKLFTTAIKLSGGKQKEPLINRAFSMFTMDMYVQSIVDFSTLKRVFPENEGLFNMMRNKTVENIKKEIFYDGKKGWNDFWKG